MSERVRGTIRLTYRELADKTNAEDFQIVKVVNKPDGDAIYVTRRPIDDDVHEIPYRVLENLLRLPGGYEVINVVVNDLREYITIVIRPRMATERSILVFRVAEGQESPGWTLEEYNEYLAKYKLNGGL